MSGAGPRAPRILVGGVGYRNLRDLSVGPLLTDAWATRAWPEGVELEDLGYGPIGIMHNLDAREPYERLVLISASQDGRPPGEVRSWAWTHELPPEEEIQARVAEAIGGVVGLENLLVIATYFGKLPRDVAVIEVEIADEGFGEGFSPEVSAALPRVLEEVERLTFPCESGGASGPGLAPLPAPRAASPSPLRA